MLPKLGSRFYYLLQLSWLPVNHSMDGVSQSYYIVIGIALKNCIEGTAPTSCRTVDSHMQPLVPNLGLCCMCQNWRCYSIPILTSARQTMWKCWSFPMWMHGLIAGCIVANACTVKYVSVLCQDCQNVLYSGISKLETHLCSNVNFRWTIKAECSSSFIVKCECP